MVDKISNLWNKIYGKKDNDNFNELLSFLDSKKEIFSSIAVKADKFWYKNAIVYSLYVDSFAGNFDGMIEKLDYLQELGINTLWLLPILDSPMRDQGFDIKDFYTIREDLGSIESFKQFIEAAHKHEIKILFDMAVNHTSDQHQWFQDAKKDKNSTYRDFYIWNDNVEKYSEARLLFKGMVDSNWEYNQDTNDYFFHRFYEFQPDLNYRNSNVLIEMVKTFVHWKEIGVDGLRMDAIPFIWKEDNTNCEDLENTHNILKILRLALDYVQEGTLLIAEANMEPKDVVKYFGNADECQAAYHFPLMPQFYLSLAEGNYSYILEALSPENTPEIPKNTQWMSFLRCHDELTLEFVSQEIRDKMNQYYLHDEKFSFREGEGIAGRLAYLLENNPQKILIMFSMLFSTEGTPIIYYGDEVGLGNNEIFYEQNAQFTGYKDARFFNRGDMNWGKVVTALLNKDSHENEIFFGLKKIIQLRSEYNQYFTNKAVFIQNKDKGIYGLIRNFNENEINIYHNLSNHNKIINVGLSGTNLINDRIINSTLELKKHEYAWIKGD